MSPMKQTPEVIDLMGALRESLAEAKPPASTPPAWGTPPETDGGYTDVPMSEYLAWPVWSNSLLKVWSERTPNFARWCKDNRLDDEETAARALGTLVHTAVLEPDKLESEFTPEPEPDPEVFRKANGDPGDPGGVRRLKSFRDAVAELAESGRTVVTAADWRHALLMRDAVHAHPAGAALLAAPGPVECSYIVTDPETGVRVKVRPDKLASVGAGFVNVNVKTTRNADRDAFMVDVYRFRYFVAFGLYRMALGWLGLDDVASVALAIDTAGPPEDRVACHEMDEGTVQAGEELARKYLREVAACEASGKWPGHAPEVRSLSLPHWAWGKVDEELATDRYVVVR